MFEKVIGKKPEPATAPSSTPTQEVQRSVSPSSTPARSSSASSSPSGRNVLSSDVEINGSVKFSSDLVVDGKIEGQIESDGSLTIGENAHIKAEIKTRSVVIYGKVHGNIEVTDKVELKANAELVGNIKGASLSIEPGAIFVGKSTVGTPSIKPSATASVKSSQGGSNKPAQAGKPA